MAPVLRTVLPLAIAAVAFVAGDVAADRSREKRPEEPELGVSYLPTTEALRIVSMGYDGLMADALWLRTVSYYGAWRMGSHGLDFFRALTNRVVDLDPLFLEGYKFGAFVLADDLNSMESAYELIEKGMAEMPDEWELPFTLGLLEYTVHLDDDKAADWFQRAAAMDTAPQMAHRFAAFVTGRAGDLEKAHALWDFVLKTSPNPDMRAKAAEYMEQLQAAIEGTGPIPEWAVRRRMINGRVERKDDDA